MEIDILKENIRDMEYMKYMEEMSRVISEALCISFDIEEKDFNNIKLKDLKL